MYGLRAARGARMPWGLAEEAGRAARWLCARGLPGAEWLQRLLARLEGSDHAVHAPLTAESPWRATAAPLCPVTCGAALSDGIGNPQSLRLAGVACPALLAPFVARVVPDGHCLALRWQDCELLIGPDGLLAPLPGLAALGVETGDEVALVKAPLARAAAPLVPRAGAVAVPSATWQALDALAHRTYVPASDESRARGAGAGALDND